MGGNKIQYLILVVSTESFCLKADSGEYWGTEFVMCMVRMGHKFRQERMMSAIPVGASSGGTHSSVQIT
jgi:hypothetical protein